MNDRDREILQFESQWWQLRGNKERAIHDTFDMSAIRYAQRLNAVLDDPQAQLEFPLLVNRLRRIRDRRAHARDARRGLM